MSQKGLTPIAVILIIVVIIIGYVFYSADRKIAKIQEENARVLNTPSPTPEPPSGIQTLEEIYSSKSFVKRQFDNDTKFFLNQDYPQEVTNLNDPDLVGMKCTPELVCVEPYEECTYYPEGADRSEPSYLTSDQGLLTLVKNSNETIDKSTTVYGNAIQEATLCRDENGREILRYATGGGGGGGGSVDYIGLVNSDKTIKRIAAIKESTAYFGCQKPLQLTKDNILYYQCNGEGASFIYKISLNDSTALRILKCMYKNYEMGDDPMNSQCE